MQVLPQGLCIWGLISERLLPVRIVGILVDNLGYHNMYAVAMGCAVAAFVVLLAFFHPKETEENMESVKEAV